MNFKSYFVGVWNGIVGKQEITEAREAGFRDAQTMIGSYVEGFEAGVATKLQASQRRLLGQPEEEEETIEAEFEVVEKDSPEDYEGWTRPELMGECRNREIGYTRKSTSKQLIQKLCK